MTKTELTDKLGKRFFLENDYTLAAKLNYVSGIPTFDQFLGGKTLKQINAVIHLTKYPKGLLIKIQKNFSSFPFGISYSEIKNTILSDKTEIPNLTFEATKGNKIIFSIKPADFYEIKQFLEDIRLPYHYDRVKSEEDKRKERNTNEGYHKSYNHEERKHHYNEQQNKESYNNNTDSPKMTREKALSILGLKINATNDEIKQTYRRLVKKFNTDQRNNYEEHVKHLLDEKMKEINSAKDFLLK